MPAHDWSRVTHGDFHDFHSSWITHLKESLNDGLLPDGYYAQSEQHAGRTIADILTLSARMPPPNDQAGFALAEAPPRVSFKMVADDATSYRVARRTVTIRHRSGRQVIAMIEVVSPGNKDGQQHLRQFTDKAVSAIRQGIHLLVVDLHPPGSFDPDGIHGVIWDEVGGGGFDLPANRPFTLVAYLAEQLPEAYVEPIAVRMELPEMPVFLNSDSYVSVPLEKTYMEAYRGVPRIVREVIDFESSS